MVTLRAGTLIAHAANMRWISLSALALAACSGSATGVGSGSSEPCVTASASYVARLVEKSGGTCGSVPDTVVNTSADGEFHPAPGCAGTRTVNGCSVVF